ncbi:hypothetical protein [Evansella cellulosilytica]|uniref:BppU N-terminal domain-containing protein n=1 Tax=Evansella cellulosilytica (strain ATCC 21833 / DSM 2522 / FERM P-1141 / JCM 9156 / N-4) TaxID=649639 RepID=E6U1K7_EVAC2|nr:hypothetical protein [Evansella cellulosilytica]ADU30370.1 hypothetical protein Bcell_2109 [Evansella cellulosilytica DSM 2522]
MEYRTKQNDTKNAMKVRFYNKENEPLNLENLDVQFIMVKSFRKEPKVKRTIDTKENNIAYVVWEVGDTDEVGLFRAEFKVTYADGRRETYPNQGYINVHIESEVG